MDNPHINDSLLDGITFGDLITMVHSNEPTVDAEAVFRCFGNLLQDNIHHARRQLNQKLEFIISSVTEGRE